MGVPWAARPPLPDGAPRWSRNVVTHPYLRAAAELAAASECGEGWLLQPKIVDMPDLEYRCCAPVHAMLSRSETLTNEQEG
jgi:hypothetical protein